MRPQNLKWWSTLFVVMGLALNANAQTPQRPVKRRPATTNNNQSAYGNSAYGNTTTSAKKDTTKQAANASSAYGNTTAAPVSIDTTLPITVITSSNDGLLDSTRPSLRNDASVELNLIKDRTPLTYENIREDDAVYRVRVWREIDAREKMNQAFRYGAKDDNGSLRFINILIRAIKDGSLTAFSPDDDRFTTPITPEKAISAFGGGFDTSKRYDLQGNIVGYVVQPKAIDPDSIYQFKIKEEWVFDKETSRMYVRILGIAPVYNKYSTTGILLGPVTAWWVYYPDARPVLSKYEVYNPKNFGNDMTWEELFESRMFSSYIIKSSMDNPSDQNLTALIKDPLFRLLQGEKIKDKIFDYEQNLWQY
jgi:gliding motility associated protien GldN